MPHGSLDAALTNARNLVKDRAYEAAVAQVR